MTGAPVRTATRASLSRRDFLKLAGTAAGGAALPRALQGLAGAQDSRPNVLIVVFDAWSAKNMSLYGYARETTPNLDRLADRAIVYHEHYAAANFTTPGTASLLTGVYPWTHRALRWAAPVHESISTKSIFHAFDGYHCITYSHNPLAYSLFEQFLRAIDTYIPQERLFLTFDEGPQALFPRDRDTFGLAWKRITKRTWNGGYAYSLLLSDPRPTALPRAVAELEGSFPRGMPRIPNSESYFTLEQAVDYTVERLKATPTPFLGYFHFLPPHRPYNTEATFYNRFRRDGFEPPAKPSDANFAMGKRMTPEYLGRLRQQYDEYMLYADAELGRLIDWLDGAGLMDSTWLVITSDHGEMFERGIWEHITEVLYEPVIRVPLVIFEPGRTSRADVRTPTSATDLLPTLLHVTGGPGAGWAEGSVLPPFAGGDGSARGIYAVEAKGNPSDRPLTTATLMLVKDQWKLTHFTGYGKLRGEAERIELYDIEADPEELDNLANREARVAAEMLSELKTRLSEADRRFARVDGFLL